MTSAGVAWTRPGDLRTIVNAKFWKASVVSEYLSEVPFPACALPIKGPTAKQIGASFDEVRQWRGQWADAASRLPITVATTNVGGKDFGRNQLPTRVHISSYDGLFALAGRQREIATLARLREVSAREAPGLGDWLVSNPLVALRHSDDWMMLCRTAQWIANHPAGGLFLRQVDVPGVDTKFIEGNKAVLARLLDHLLPAERINFSEPAGRFIQRYNFRPKPDAVWLRVLDTDSAIPTGWNLLGLEVAAASELKPSSKTVFVIENEITFHAWPAVPGSLAIWGQGRAVEKIQYLPWLADCAVFYTGDIDTHGFAMLDRVRRLLPAVESLLMDESTLLAHRSQWVTETTHSTGPFDRLTARENATRLSLHTAAAGTVVRLEQERISPSLIENVARVAAAKHG